MYLRGKPIKKIMQLLTVFVSVISWPAYALIITDELEVILIPGVGDSFISVSSQQTYGTLVVACTNILASNGDNEVVVRLQNVSASGFDILLQNPDGDPVTPGDVYCILAEDGVSALPDGTIFEAHTVESDGTHGWRRGWNNETPGPFGAEIVTGSIGGAYAANSQPAVLGQVMTYNDTGYSAFHSYDCESQTRPPFIGDDTDTLSDGICVVKHVGKTALVDSDRDPETLGYIVMEQAIGSFDGITYRSALGGDTIAGVTGSPPYSYAIGMHYDYGVATQEAMDGGHGGWAVFYNEPVSGDPLTGNNIYLAIEEDTTDGSNRAHTNEQIAYWVFAGTDRGDAPSSYLEASHQVTPDLSLGPIANGDPDANTDDATQFTALADGDDAVASGEVDDEDGVSFRSSKGANYTVFADVEVNNNTGGAVTVCAWLDVPSGGSVNNVFDVSDGQCQSVATAGASMVTFQWPGLPDDQLYTTFARVRVTSDALTTSDAAGATTLSDGEVEDYRVLFDFTPTAVTIGQVNIQSLAVSDFLLSINAAELDDQSLLDLLQNLDPTTTLDSDSSRADIEQGLLDYLDPDEDGNVTLFSWDTLEQRGTIGFYVERRQADQTWYRVNEELLPAIIVAPMGAEYQLLDPSAIPIRGESGTASYQYRLIELEATGATREYGPFELQF